MQKQQTPPKEIVEACNCMLSAYGLDFSVISTPPEKNLKKYLTMKEAIEYSGLQRWTLARKIKSGELQASKLSDSKSGKILIAVKDLDDYITGHRVKSCGGVS